MKLSLPATKLALLSALPLSALPLTALSLSALPLTALPLSALPLAALSLAALPPVANAAGDETANPAESRTGDLSSEQTNTNVYEHATGPLDISVTFIINNRAVGYKDSAGELKQAEDLLQKALKIARFTEQGDSKQSLISALDCAGVMYYRSGEFKKSWNCFQDSLELKKQFGSDRDIATACSLLGKVARARLDYDSAENCYTELCRLKEKEYGKNSLECAKAHMDLAYLYYERCNNDKAQQNRVRVEEILAANKQAGNDYSSDLAPVSLSCAAASSTLPMLSNIATSIISVHEMAIAEKNAEEEALNSLKNGYVPKRRDQRIIVVTPRRHFNSYAENDDSELERKRLDLAREMLEAQEKQRKAEEEKRREEAADAVFKQRELQEARVRQEADYANRQSEAQQAATQRQREAAGTGTSYMSRYHH